MRPGEVAPQAYQGTPQTQSPVASAPQRRSLGSGMRTAAVVADSAWSWYMDPRVLGTRTATYLSSVRKNGDIQVTKVARGSAELSHTVLAARFQADDHNGGIVAKPITLTISGINDSPTIEALARLVTIG